jgi:hypothetical protein
MLFRAANAVMALCFLYSAYVQHNDPDPIRWMAIYLAAAVVCVLAVMRKLKWQAALVVTAVAFVWAATLASSVFQHFPTWEDLTTMQMLNVGVEETRELLGLMIVAGWMGFAAALLRSPRSDRA